jgi:hypothetical protein
MAAYPYEKQPSRKGELRRRWRAFMDDGSLAGLGSEGRLVALYVFLNANWTSCEIRYTCRRAAKSLCVHPTSVRRGTAQLVKAGILEVFEKGEGTARTAFRICERAQGVRAPDTRRARERAQGVRAPDTQCARSGHEACAERAPVVRAARTGCARNSVFLSGSSVRTSEKNSEATAMAGAGPARPCPPSQDSRSSAAG